MESWPSPEVPALPSRGLPLRVYDTSTDELRPVASGTTATMYVCGITPYDATHLGHAATYLAYDLAQRVLRDSGHDVNYVQNVTDIDDDILKRARETGDDWDALGQRETQLFREDLTALRILPPTHFIGAVESMEHIVELIGRLRDNGTAYDVDGDLYFSVDAAPRFGTIANRDYDTMLELSGQRGGDPDRAGKKNPLDPLLWLAARPDEPSWPAPWGDGRPGWHVECAAIALHHLGAPMDIHGGGTDLAFPHHEMCAAEATTATGVWPFARCWVHTAMVRLDGEKMSKSLGNLVFVRELRSQHEPAAVRLSLLDHHYGTAWQWSHADITRAEDRLDRWRRALSHASGPPADDVLDGVRRHLADDLDAPGALQVVDTWADALLRGSTGDGAAPALVRDVVDALLGVEV